MSLWQFVSFRSCITQKFVKKDTAISQQLEAILDLGEYRLLIDSLID